MNPHKFIEVFQQRLEDEGIGYRCRRCGISVFTSKTSPKLCSACEKFECN